MFLSLYCIDYLIVYIILNEVIKNKNKTFHIRCIIKLLKKYIFVSHTKHTQRKINESTSFAIDNMYDVSFKI